MRLPPRHRVWLIALAIAGATVIVYWQTTTFSFVGYDDPRYVPENPRVLRGVTLDNLAWAFTTFEFSNWHPLTWISHMLDVSLHGTNPAGHHLTSVLIHALNSALLMLLVTRLTAAPWRSALVAALFALHPLHVESVAWVSERKDVLSTFFGLLAMLAWAGGTAASTAREQARAAIITFICFAASLMSKPMLVTLPFVLLLLDIWPLQRTSSASDLLRLALAKTPLLIASAISCVLTIMAQQSGGAVRDLTHVKLGARLVNAVVASGMYLWQTIWPANLAVFYPMPHDGWPTATLVLTIIALLAISVACAIAFVRGWRAPLIGWLWYLGTLVPVIGIVQVGAQARADRYTYFPLIGVFIMLAFAGPRVPAALQRVTSIAGAGVVFALASVSFVQVGYWRNSMTLAAHALDVTRNNVVAHVILGNALIEQQRLEEGIQHLELARDIDPLAPQAWHNLAFAYDQAGRRDDAITACRRAIVLRPELAENHYNLGLLLEAEGDIAGAKAALQAALDVAARADDEVVQARARGGALEAAAQPMTALPPHEPQVTRSGRACHATLWVVPSPKAMATMIRRRARRMPMIVWPAQSYSGPHDPRSQKVKARKAPGAP